MIEKILILLVVAVVMLVVFGNRLPQVMGDLGKGMRAFKQGMNEAEGEGNSPTPKARRKQAAKVVKGKAVKSKAKPRV